MIFLFVGVVIIAYLIVGVATLATLGVSSQNVLAGVLSIWLWPLVTAAIVAHISVQGMFVIFIRVKKYVKTLRLWKL